MRHLLSVQLLIVLIVFNCKNMASQIYLPFFFKQTMQYDTPLQELGQKGVNHYYNNKIDSAIYCYEQLSKLTTNNTVNYNLAVFYGLIKDEQNTLKCIEKYFRNAASNGCSVYGFLVHAPAFRFLSANKEYKAILEKQRLERRKRYPKSNLHDSELIEYCDLKEQEILGNPNYLNGNNKTEKNKELQENANKVLKYLMAEKLYGIQQLGCSIAHLELIVLHMDYAPNDQLKFGKLFMNADDSLGYNKKQAAYIIDRALKNLKQPQEYGTIRLYDNNNYAFYQMDDSLKVVERRKLIGMQTLEEYQVNNQITK